MISKHVIIACLLLATTIVLSKAQLTFENDPSTVDGRPTVILDAKEYMETAASFWGPKAIKLNHFKLGGIGPFGYGSIGGIKMGKIGNLKYGSISGISGNQFLGSPNTNTMYARDAPWMMNHLNDFGVETLEPHNHRENVHHLHERLNDESIQLTESRPQYFLNRNENLDEMHQHHPQIRTHTSDNFMGADYREKPETILPMQIHNEENMFGPVRRFKSQEPQQIMLGTEQNMHDNSITFVDPLTERSRQSMGSHLFSSHHTINNNNDDAAVDHHTSFGPFDQRKRADARLDNNNVENESSAAAYNPNARTFFHKHNDKDGKKGNKYYNTVNYYYTNDDYGHGGYGHENYGHEEYGGYGHEAYDHGQYKHEVYDREGYGHGGYEHEGSDYGYKGYGHEGGYDHAYGGHNSFRNSDAHSKSIVGKYNSNQSHTPLKGHYKSSHGSAGYHHGSSSHQGTSSHSGGHKVPTHYNNHH